jgi:hypothetical protein
MQDSVGLALLHVLQQLTDFQCGRRNDLDTAPFRLRHYFVHYRKTTMGAGPNNEPLASPGDFFLGRKRRVAEPFAELLRRSFFPFPYFAAVDHHIMGIALPLDLDLAKFDQSRFHISTRIGAFSLNGLRESARSYATGDRFLRAPSPGAALINQTAGWVVATIGQ